MARMNALSRDITFEEARLIQPTYTAVQTGTYAKWFKRPLDIVLVLLGLPIALPLIALMALLVARDGGRPFYRQPRVGRNGKAYTMWKLRTMVRDADAALAAHLDADADAAAEWSANQKLRNDPRITRIGARLRASSMDELPQIWNVLTGEMSLIGPRPMLQSQQIMYHNDAYYDLRPGITGLWQVSRRNDVSFAERAEIDADYAAGITFWSDMKILFRTVSVVISRTGH